MIENTHTSFDVAFPFKIIDLSHTLMSNIPTWDAGCGFVQEITDDYLTVKNQTSFRVMALSMHAGIGTHLDAPRHCIRNGASVDVLDLNTLCMPCAVIDVSSKAHETFMLSPQDILEHEDTHGLLVPGSCVMVYTGWDARWQDPDAYRNTLVFPSVSREAAALLLTRGVTALGIDTLSPDPAASKYPVHHLFLGAGKILLENVAGLAHMPPRGAFIMAMPLKLHDGTESPIRLIGLVEKEPSPINDVGRSAPGAQ